MATNHTPNYALPQWAADDAILRADFNDLTQKLDAALAQSETRVKLLDYTSTADAAPLRIDVSGVDFTAYRRVRVYVENLHMSDSGYVRLNNRSDMIYFNNATNDTTVMFLTFSGSGSYGTDIEMNFHGRSGYLWADARVCNYNSVYHTPVTVYAHGSVDPAAIPPASVSTIDLVPTATGAVIAAGVRVVIYGELL